MAFANAGVFRRESGVQAFWRSQNLAAGRIHSARGSEIPGPPQNRQILWGGLPDELLCRPTVKGEQAPPLDPPPPVCGLVCAPKAHRSKYFRQARVLPKMMGMMRRRRESGDQAFWRSQNLAAGRIHSARGSEIPGPPQNRQILWGGLPDELLCRPTVKGEQAPPLDPPPPVCGLVCAPKAHRSKYFRQARVLPKMIENRPAPPDGGQHRKIRRFPWIKSR